MVRLGHLYTYDMVTMPVPLMTRPSDKADTWWGRGLDECYSELNVSGSYVEQMFFNQGIWHEDNIPKELKEKNWHPESSRRYNIWWYNNAPGDFCNPGENHLFYIEEV